MNTLPFRSALLLLVSSTAMAAEVELEGSFQSRGRFFDSLSLTNEVDAGIPESQTFYVEHRMWLRPRVLVSDKVGFTADVKGFDNVVWGNQPDFPVSFTNEPLLDEGLTAPTSDTDSRAPLLDITLWRAWADIDTDYGRLSFGRMPLHWGMGIWQNDGMGLNAEYGDTADRIQFEGLVQDSVFVRAAFDTHAENFLNENDDTYAASLAAAYRSERLVFGGQLHYRHTDQIDGGEDLDLVTVDAAMDAELGKLTVNAEFLGRFGSGDLPNGFDDVSVTQFGAALDAKLDLDPWRLRVEAGFASGDKDDTDAKVKAFAFDRDHNVGIMLFEQPMPIFRSAAATTSNGNRNFDNVLLGNSVSNALYVKPTISRALLEGLEVEASVLMARAAALPERFTDRAGYGTEILAGVRWMPEEHVEFDARGGVFLPGSYFKNFTSDTIEGYEGNAVGVQLTGRVRF